MRKLYRSAALTAVLAAALAQATPASASASMCVMKYMNDLSQCNGNESCEAQADFDLNQCLKALVTVEQ